MSTFDTCYIVANMLPPEYGWMTRAPGMRAQQLAHQARQHFKNVKYIIFFERFNMVENENGLFQRLSARSDTILIEKNFFHDFVHYADPSVIIFTQADFAAQAKMAKSKHLVIYDILAPKVLELENGDFDQKEIDDYRSNHAKMIDYAERVLINGDKLYHLLGLDFGLDANIYINKFTPVTALMDLQLTGDYIVIPATEQRWTSKDNFLKIIHSYLASNSSTKAFVIQANTSCTHSNRYLSALSLLPNTRMLCPMSTNNYHEILAHSSCLLSWDRGTTERIYSTSTRIIHAVSLGLPVLHQKNTGLDSFWPKFPGVRLDSRISPSYEDVEIFIKSVHDGEYQSAISEAREEMRKVLSSTFFFEDL